MTQVFKGTGVISYRKKNWITLWVDDEIASYYRSTIMTPGLHKMITRPMFRAHITVVNGKHEPKAQYSSYWKKHVGRRVSFTYTPEIHFYKGKWFIKARCKIMEDIREELGLRRVFARRPPHITIARVTDTPERIGKLEW